MLLHQVCSCNENIDIAVLSQLGFFLSCTTMYRNIMSGLVVMLIPKRSLCFHTYWIRPTCFTYDTYQVSHILYHTYDTTTAATLLQAILQSVAAFCFLLLLYVCTIQGLARARFASCSIPFCFMKLFFNANLVGANFLIRTWQIIQLFQLCVSQSTRANKRNDSSSVTASGRYRRGGASYLPQYSSIVCGWVMAILLHQVCMQRNDQSRRTFVKVSQLGFLSCYHSVLNHKERFCIHVNDQTIVTFPGRLVCIRITYSCAYNIIRVRFTMRDQLTTLLWPLRPTGGTVSERCCMSVVVQRYGRMPAGWVTMRLMQV